MTFERPSGTTIAKLYAQPCRGEYGDRHRDGDPPAVIHADGTRQWFRHGELHRDGDEPAVIYADGNRRRATIVPPCRCKRPHHPPIPLALTVTSRYKGASARGRVEVMDKRELTMRAVDAVASQYLSKADPRGFARDLIAQAPQLWAAEIAENDLRADGHRVTRQRREAIWRALGGQ